MDLSGQQRKQLKEALISAFPNKNALEQFVSYELDKNLDVIAGGDNLETVVFNLIQTAKAQGWLKNLLLEASKSANSKLGGIAKELLRHQKEAEQQEAQSRFCLDFFPILANTDEIILEYGNSKIFLNSTNFDDHYIRHQYGQGKISPIKSNDNQGKEDACFLIRKSPNRKGIFFESVNFRNKLLRNCRGRIVLENCEGRNDEQSRYDDAAFNIYHGLDGDNDSYSFEAINYPGKFIRHRNGNLWVESACENKNIATFKGDASFKIITNPIFLP